MIITIDGPAGAGKSTAARSLAERLGFEYLDTGAMYRAVTWAGLQRNIDFGDANALPAVLGSMRLEMSAGRVVVNGHDVTAEIRRPEVTEASAAVADSAVVQPEDDAVGAGFPRIRRELVPFRDVVVCQRALRRILLDADGQFIPIVVKTPRQEIDAGQGVAMEDEERPLVRRQRLDIGT